MIIPDGLTIGAPRTWSLDRPADAAAVRDELWSEGYFAAPPSVPAELLARCQQAIELVRAEGAPPLAAFAFDAPWELAAVLGAHADAAFTGGARLMPAFWAWRLEDGSRGWEPHRDRPEREVDDDGQPEAIALWVPLTDATTDNGCMYLVPAPWDPLYLSSRSRAEVIFQQAVRAVPARAGAVLGWTSRLLHWGAMARAGTPPRISISFEYQAADRPAFDGEVFEHGWTPPPSRRQALIDAQWTRYEHMHGEDEERKAALDAVLGRLLG